MSDTPVGQPHTRHGRASKARKCTSEENNNRPDGELWDKEAVGIAEEQFNDNWLIGAESLAQSLPLNDSRLLHPNYGDKLNSSAEVTSLSLESYSCSPRHRNREPGGHRAPEVMPRTQPSVLSSHVNNGYIEYSR